jgi:hypothetical protein
MSEDTKTNDVVVDGINLTELQRHVEDLMKRTCPPHLLHGVLPAFGTGPGETLGEQTSSGDTITNTQDVVVKKVEVLNELERGIDTIINTLRYLGHRIDDLTARIEAIEKGRGPAAFQATLRPGVYSPPGEKDGNDDEPHCRPSGVTIRT